MPSFGVRGRGLWSGACLKIEQIHFYHLHIVVFVHWMSLIPISERLIECTKMFKCFEFHIQRSVEHRNGKKCYHSSVALYVFIVVRTSKWRKSVKWTYLLFFVYVCFFLVLVPVPITIFISIFIYENIEMYPYSSLIPYSTW